jgi:two-component system chemotaxis response regulator CheB
MRLKAIVVDDSIIFRKVVRDCLGTIPEVEVVDVAKDGFIAMEKIRHLKPDFITLDLEMPGMDGMQVLQAIQREGIATHVIMVSSHTQRGAATTTKALQAGAFDFILKPDQDSALENAQALAGQLTSCVQVLRSRATRPKPPCSSHQRASAGKPTLAELCGSSTAGRAIFPARASGETDSHQLFDKGLDAICIGISTGGPHALSQLIPKLTTAVDVPILIVQHMPPMFTKSLAEHLNSNSALEVQEGAHGERLRGGRVYIAPGGLQMHVGGFPGAWRIETAADAPRKGCRPSVDELFDSASRQFGNRLLGIVMTGMGDDGTEGCRQIAQRGGRIWVQDESSSTVFGMPRSVVESGVACEVRSLGEIVSGINRYGRRGSRCNSSSPSQLGPNCSSNLSPSSFDAH